MESAVLLEAVQIGAQGCLGKVLFPQTRGELGHVLGRMLTDPLQDVYEIIVGIDPLQAAGTEQTLDDTEMLCTKFSPAEEPVFSPQGNGSDLALDVVGVDGHVRFFQKDLQRPLATVDVGEGLGEGIAG